MMTFPARLCLLRANLIEAAGNKCGAVETGVRPALHVRLAGLGFNLCALMPLGHPCIDILSHGATGFDFRRRFSNAPGSVIAKRLAVSIDSVLAADGHEMTEPQLLRIETAQRCRGAWKWII